MLRQLPLLRQVSQFFKFDTPVKFKIINQIAIAMQEQLGKVESLNFTFLKQVLSDQKNLPPRAWAMSLIDRFITLAKNQPNVLYINEPAIVIGDIHGQFYDLLKIFSLFPSLETQPKEYFLFLGDYVDRGPMGLETTLLLFAFKIKYPKKVILMRGNHQTRQMTQLMNFYLQVCQKYDQNVYFRLMDAFDCLPLVCIINKNYFCVHGGITSSGESLQQLNQLDRFVEIPLNGSLCDLLWSDPVQQQDGSIYTSEPYISNYQRNCSIFFGSEHTRSFLKKTKLITVIRAHEVQIEGYKQHMWPKWKDIPMVYTLFSAPNYCGSYGNLGAILTISNSQFNIRQFKQTNPKYYLPARYNAFNFSFPHIHGFMDQIMKRMAKRWISLKMPELKDKDIDTIIGLYLKSSHCNEQIKKDNQTSSFLKKSVELSEVECFKKSQGYFKQSQMRPSSLVFSNNSNKG